MDIQYSRFPINGLFGMDTSTRVKSFNLGKKAMNFSEKLTAVSTAQNFGVRDSKVVFLHDAHQWTIRANLCRTWPPTGNDLCQRSPDPKFDPRTLQNIFSRGFASKSTTLE